MSENIIPNEVDNILFKRVKCDYSLKEQQLMELFLTPMSHHNLVI